MPRLRRDRKSTVSTHCSQRYRRGEEEEGGGSECEGEGKERGIDGGKQNLYIQKMRIK